MVVVFVFDAIAHITGVLLASEGLQEVCEVLDLILEGLVICLHMEKFIFHHLYEAAEVCEVPSVLGRSMIFFFSD